MKRFSFLPLCLLLLAACNNTANKETRETKKKDTTAVADKTVVKDTTPVVGGDEDEHGCKASAGYTWSTVKEKCIRIFEDGIKLEPKDPSLDKTLVAYAVFKSMEDDSRVEIFMPTQKKSVILPRTAGGAGEWSSGPLKLKQWKGMYSLEDSGKLLYEGMIAK